MATRGRKPFANRKAAFQNPTEEKGVHPTILKQARKTGQLNLSGRNLSTGDDFNSSLIQPLDHIILIMFIILCQSAIIEDIHSVVKQQNLFFILTMTSYKSVQSSTGDRYDIIKKMTNRQHDKVRSGYKSTRIQSIGKRGVVEFKGAIIL